MRLESTETGVRRVLRQPGTSHFVTYAGFVTRLMAMVIDLLLLAVTWIVGGISANFVGQTSGIAQIFDFLRGYFDWVTPMQEALLSATFEVIVLLSLSFCYFTFFYTFGGATIGKYLMGLRVICSDGKPIPPLKAALRTLAYAVSSLPLYLGFLNVLLDDRRRAWHDKLTRTAVIHSWRARPDESFLRDAIDHVDRR
jgi:uncharacterized RDD family membrane protein YckC